MRFRFTPEMFLSFYGHDHRKDIADYANAALDKHLSTLPVVCANGYQMEWRPDIECESTDTHRAFLFDIEELPKKECEHIPMVHKATVGVSIYEKAECKKCGVKLKATWTAETKEG